MRAHDAATTLIIGRDDVAAVVAAVGLDHLMDEMIEGLTSAIVTFDDAATHVRTRDGFHYSHPETGLIEWMPVMQTGESTTIKVVGYHPLNPTLHELPTILSTVSVYETASGHLKGLADGTFLTALRTAAMMSNCSLTMAFPMEDALDASKTAIQDAVISWGRISGWLPWMKMRSRAGLLVHYTHGMRLHRWEDLPDVIREEIGG